MDGGIPREPAKIVRIDADGSDTLTVAVKARLHVCAAEKDN